MATIRQAVKAARAAFAENYRHSKDYDVAERAAELAVKDRGFDTSEPYGWNLLNAAMCAIRPGVALLIANMEACQDWDHPDVLLFADDRVDLGGCDQ
jgi:hypothetical protein